MLNKYTQPLGTVTYDFPVFSTKTRIDLYIPFEATFLRNQRIPEGKPSRRMKVTSHSITCRALECIKQRSEPAVLGSVIMAS